MVTALERAIGEIVEARFLGGRALGAVTIPYGKGCRTAVTWKNLGEAGTRKVVSFFGKWNAATEEFSIQTWAYADVAIGKGATITTSVDLPASECQAMPGSWDNMVVISDPTDITLVDDSLVTVGAVVFEGQPVKGQITGVSFSAI